MLGLKLSQRAVDTPLPLLASPRARIALLVATRLAWLALCFFTTLNVTIVAWDAMTVGLCFAALRRVRVLFGTVVACSLRTGGVLPHWALNTPVLIFVACRVLARSTRVTPCVSFTRVLSRITV